MILHMRPCVIFNPAAKGDKARKFRAALSQIAKNSVFKPTASSGDARRLAAAAVREGHDTVVAAGGDGTLNEVLNGIGDVQGGFGTTRLGFIPLGTVNVFARELEIPLKPYPAWEMITAGHETRVDLPWMERVIEGKPVRHHFTQLAGAGLDARAIELVSWEAKKRVGPLAYVIAGVRALCESPTPLTVDVGGVRASGELILIGNGRLYGGNFRLFPEADLRDGILEVCIFPRVTWLTLLRCSLPLAVSGQVPPGVVRRLRGATVQLESDVRVPAEVDGELMGPLPVTFGVEQLGLRMIVPA
jgi:diacylglycerol kinase (ATP)